MDRPCPNDYQNLCQSYTDKKTKIMNRVHNRDIRLRTGVKKSNFWHTFHQKKLGLRWIGGLSKNLVKPWA